mgnify:CR=1 FL=1
MDLANLALDWWYVVLLIVAVVAAAVTDLRSGKIYNAITLPALAAGLVGHALLGGLTGQDTSRSIGLIGSLLGVAMGGTMVAAWLAGGVNGGDAKLMIAIGSLTGWAFTLDVIVWGLVAAVAMAVVVMIRRRVFMRTIGRIARFLSLIATPGKPAVPTSDDSPTVPFGVALCVGTAIALVRGLVQYGLDPYLVIRHGH